MDHFTDTLRGPPSAYSSAVYIYTQITYTLAVKAVFVELPAFERHRTDYLDDKDEMADLTPKQRKALKAMLKAELESRRPT